MVGWLDHRRDGLEFEQAPGDGDGQGSLGCCIPYSLKESDTTERQNNHHHPVVELCNHITSFQNLFLTFVYSLSFLAVLGVLLQCRLSAVAVSGSYSLVTMCGLIFVVASLVAEHTL